MSPRCSAGSPCHTHTRGGRKKICKKWALNVLFGRRVDLDGFDKVGGGVGHLFGRLHKLPPGHRVGRLGGGQATRVAQRRGVFGHDGRRRQHLTDRAESAGSLLAARQCDGGLTRSRHVLLGLKNLQPFNMMKSFHLNAKVSHVLCVNNNVCVWSQMILH